MSDFDSAMRRYFRGQAAVASIVGVLSVMGFWLIGLPIGIFGFLIALPMTCLLLAYHHRLLVSGVAGDSSPPSADG
ncbi:MAG: hypothetical protein IMF18_08915 [Proteobacteria bacterium]|nr:hypothetical protein [Pseudomonadota bacterium]